MNANQNVPPISSHYNLQQDDHPAPDPYHFLRAQQSGEKNISQNIHTNVHPMLNTSTMHPALNPYQLQGMQQIHQTMNLA